MLHLENRALRVELLDPADPADRARQGLRYCWGGYLWQVHDARLGPLLAGPEFPAPAPSAFNGQGLPESFRHRTRDGRPLTWRGNAGLAIGVGEVTANAADEVALVAPCVWEVTSAPDRLVFRSRQSAAGFGCELVRQIALRDRTIVSHTRLTNVGEAPLALQWFAHPFWALSGGRARLLLPAGTGLPPNPGFAIDADGTLTFQRPFVTDGDSQFALLALPAGLPLSLSLDHPGLSRVTFAARFVPDECPVWANSRTVSVEPYLYLHLAPGESREWQLEHGFEP